MITPKMQEQPPSNAWVDAVVLSLQAGTSELHINVPRRRPHRDRDRPKILCAPLRQTKEGPQVMEAFSDSRYGSVAGLGLVGELRLRPERRGRVADRLRRRR